MFSYKMVANRVEMLFDCAGNAKTNLWNMIQAIQSHQDFLSDSLLDSVRKDLATMQKQLADLDRAIANLKRDDSGQN